MNRASLEHALAQHDEHGVLIQASKAIEVMAQSITDNWPNVSSAVMKTSGTATAKQLKGFRASAAVETDFAFDVTNPSAKTWISQHALELANNLSETTRESIRDLVDEAFDGDFDTRDLADEIESLIGDADRADTIARTETMRASNQGQLEAWNQAKQAGLLLGNEQIEWITTPDDRLCPICEPLDGQKIAFGEQFDVEGDKVYSPPAHPRCRCATGLATAGTDQSH